MSRYSAYNQPVHKLKKRMVFGVAALLLAASAALLLVPKVDDFTWIRRYPATELVETSTGIEEHRFIFHDGFPAGLLEEAAKQPRRSLSYQVAPEFGVSTSTLSINEGERTVTVRKLAEESWFAERWEAMKRAIGIGSWIEGRSR